MPAPAGAARRGEILFYGGVAGFVLNLLASLAPGVSVIASRAAIASAPLAVMSLMIVGNRREVPDAVVFMQGVLCGMPVAYALRLALVGVGYVGLWLHTLLHRFEFTARLW